MMKTLQSCSTRFILAAVLALLALTTAVAESIEDTMAKGEKAFERSDIVSAIAYYRKAAEAGHVPAQTRLAYLLNVAEQNEEALEWYRKAAAAGDAEAEFYLAGMYAEGDGTAQDPAEALRLFTASADRGYAPGKMGLRIDYEAARTWLDKGAAVNDYWSIKRLAQAHANGELGLRIDRQKAGQLEQRLAGLEEDGE